ncbi:hypothetical protein, partial [Yersinia massiliensis]|uniref:hypothetical protein n=1 Tax=Yersinia massiliensis TaxID=419257 RepID=UPI001C9691FB
GAGVASKCRVAVYSHQTLAGGQKPACGVLRSLAGNPLSGVELTIGPAGAMSRRVAPSTKSAYLK